MRSRSLADRWGERPSIRGVTVDVVTVDVVTVKW